MGHHRRPESTSWRYRTRRTRSRIPDGAYHYQCAKLAPIINTERSAAAGLNPLVDAIFENVQRHGARLQHDVIEVAEIEFVSEGFLRSPAQLLDLQLADFVRER